MKPYPTSYNHVEATTLINGLQGRKVLKIRIDRDGFIVNTTERCTRARR